MGGQMAADRAQQRLAALGANITRLREAANETKSATSRATGIDRIFLTGVEAGQRNISIAKLFDIADHFGVAPATLLSGIS
ncbi:helix-turn-helix domain-containing protein [Mycobacterium sp. TY815]|uniref:helix-turn-helix domain-containing protein n=1 Tax=Mycobacterium sp. TY815 TaxID=3050581 RepID=UPI002741788D|nr:helix-turn-helix transcriptional regulator [Mycobacterium sp. TY815]MDP7707450.1 helix-turn-helix transcriptional regulator [Mycobacterium sp. TY815]